MRHLCITANCILPGHSYPRALFLTIARQMCVNQWCRQTLFHIRTKTGAWLTFLAARVGSHRPPPQDLLQQLDAAAATPRNEAVASDGPGGGGGGGGEDGGGCGCGGGIPLAVDADDGTKEGERRHCRREARPRGQRGGRDRMAAASAAAANRGLSAAAAWRLLLLRRRRRGHDGGTHVDGNGGGVDGKEEEEKIERSEGRAKDRHDDE